MNIREAAWAAGYLDGEGHFSIRDRRVAVEVSSVNPGSLRELQRLFGGTIEGGEGSSEASRYAWRWRVYGERAFIVCVNVRPYLVIKGPEADAILAVRTHPRGAAAAKAAIARAFRHRHHEYRPGTDGIGFTA